MVRRPASGSDDSARAQCPEGVRLPHPRPPNPLEDDPAVEAGVVRLLRGLTEAITCPAPARDRIKARVLASLLDHQQAGPLTDGTPHDGCGGEVSHATRTQ